MVGDTEWDALGLLLRREVGCLEGLAEDVGVGTQLLGVGLGPRLGDMVGGTVGYRVGEGLGLLDGWVVGFKLGRFVGYLPA